ncbi:MAG: hypothetical protein QM487_11075 [Candidatus Marithrix sp.]
MAKPKLDKFIMDLISDIDKLSRLLKNFTNVTNNKAFQNITASLRRTNKFKYAPEPLELSFENDKLPKHLSHSNIENLRLYFSVDLNIEYKKIAKNEDPFNELEFNIYAYGMNKNNRNGSELVYSIHFDKHICKKGDNPSKEVHPMYHFQFGGRKLKEKNIDIGQALFFDAPRIMHHPMEFILGLDFVLSNFFPDVWEKLRENPEYVNILKKYQEYFVLPYYKSIVDYFDSTVLKPAPWNAQKIYPQLVEKMDDPKQIGRKRDSHE